MMPFLKAAQTTKSVSGSLAAEAGLFALIASSDPTGVATAAQGLKFFAEALSGIVELAKALNEQKAQEGDAEGRVRRLFKCAALEAYLAALTERFRDFPKPFRKHVGKNLTSTNASLPDADLNIVGESASIYRPIFDALDGQLLELMMEDAESETRCRDFVKETRRTAEKKLEFCHVEARYEAVRNLIDQARARRQIELLSLVVAKGSGPELTVAKLEKAGASSGDAAASPTTPRLNIETAAAPEWIGRLRELFERSFASGKKEVDNGSCQVGEQIFGKLVADLRGMSEPGLADLLARSLYNQAVALTNLRKEKEAAEVFNSASEVNAGSQRVPLSRYFSLYCSGEYSAAREELAQLRNKASLDASSIDLHEGECFLREGNFDSALAIVHEPRSVPAVTIRAFALCGLGRHEQAKSELDVAIATWPSELQLELAFAHVLARPLIDGYYMQRAMRNVAPPSDVTTLKEALDRFQKVLQKAKRSGLKNLVYESLNWSALIALSLGDAKSALGLIKEGLAEWPTDAVLLTNRQVAMVRLQDFRGALEAATALNAVPGFEQESLILQASARIALGEFAEARELIAAIVAAEPNSHVSDFRVAGVRMRTAAHFHDDGLIRKIADELATDKSTNPMSIAVAGEFLESFSERERADQLIAIAQERATGDQAYFVRGVAAKILFKRGNWGAAVRKFGEDGVDPADSIFADEILICLFHLDDLRGVVQLAARLQNNAMLSIAGRRVLAGAYARLQNPVEAEKHAAVILASPEASPIDFANSFLLKRSFKPLQQALRVLEEGSHKWPENIHLRTSLAQAYLASDRFKDSLAQARKVSELSPGSEAEQHIWALYAVSKIPPTLLSDNEKNLIARSLGKHPGIKQLQLAGPDGKFDPTLLLQELKDHSEHASYIVTEARKHRLPGSVVAGLLGYSIFDFWWHMTRDPSGFVFIAVGSGEELQSEQPACAKARIVVTDYSMLCTFSALGRLELLGQLFETIVIPSATRSVFLDELESLKVRKPSTGTAVYHDGRLVFIEADPNEDAIKRRILSDVIELFDHANVSDGAPSPEIWQENKEIFETKALQGGVDHAFLTAKSLNVSFGSDEVLIRGLAAHLGIPTFCTTTVIARAQDEGFLTETDREEMLRRMVEMNYGFVSTPHGFLRRHFRKTKYRPDRVSTRLLSEVGFTTWATHTSLLELGHAAADLWLHNNEPGAWPQTDWLPIARRQIAKGALDDLRHFALGVALELSLFPTEAEECVNAVLESPEIDVTRRRAIQEAFAKYALMMAYHVSFGANVNTVWKRHWLKRER